jgi:hypothetical protein
VANISRARTHPLNTNMMSIKAIETFRVVMPRNSLEKLVRLKSMGKKPLERQYLQKGRKKLRKNTQF